MCSHTRIDYARGYGSSLSMARITVGVGQRVAAGTDAGTAAMSPGPHLHLEYRIPDSFTPSGQRIVDPRKRLSN